MALEFDVGVGSYPANRLLSGLATCTYVGGRLWTSSALARWTFGEQMSSWTISVSSRCNSVFHIKINICIKFFHDQIYQNTFVLKDKTLIWDFCLFHGNVLMCLPHRITMNLQCSSKETFHRS